MSGRNKSEAEEKRAADAGKRASALAPADVDAAMEASMSAAAPPAERDQRIASLESALGAALERVETLELANSSLADRVATLEASRDEKPDLAGSILEKMARTIDEMERGLEGVRDALSNDFGGKLTLPRPPARAP